MGNYSIGLGIKYYTLWEVLTTPNGEFISRKFVRNLTTKLDTAVKMAKDLGINTEIDYQLRGEKASRKLSKVTIKQSIDYSNKCLVGKYKNTPFNCVLDTDYLLWYYNNITKNNKTLNNLLAGYGLLFKHNNQYYTSAKYARLMNSEQTIKTTNIASLITSYML